MLSKPPRLRHTTNAETTADGSRARPPQLQLCGESCHGSRPSPWAQEKPMHLQARERERDPNGTITCQTRNEIVPHRSKCGFSLSGSSTITSLGTASSASNYSNLQGLDALKASITVDHDGTRPLKLCRVAWVDEAHGIAALLRGAVNGGRTTSHCNADASALVARDACNCSWRSWCSLIHQSDRSASL